MATSPAAEGTRSVRVLVVDDADPVRQTIRAMLDLHPDFHVVGEAADGESAIAAARETRPDVVLMDINLPLLDGIRATSRIVRETGVNVVMISVENGQEYFRRAMKAGARDFLVKPFSSEALAEAVRRAGGGRARSSAGTDRTGRVISVFGAKGGVGVSTVAANLALALASEREPVVAVDLELEFGGLDMLFDVNPRLTVADLCRENAAGDEELVRAALAQVRDFPVWLLAAPMAPHLASLVDGEARPDRSRAYVRDLLRVLRGMYAHVTVDAGRGFRDGHLQALDESDLVLFVVTPDLPALAASRRALAVLRDTLGIDGERLRVVLNRADEGAGLGRDDIAAALGAEVDFLLPSERLAVAAANVGLPVAVRKQRSKLGDGIRGVAQRVAAPAAAETGMSAPGGAGPAPRRMRILGGGR